MFPTFFLRKETGQESFGGWGGEMLLTLGLCHLLKITRGSMQEHTDFAALVSPTFKLQKRTFSAKLPEGKNDVTAIQMYGLHDINFTSVLFFLRKRSLFH